LKIRVSYGETRSDGNYNNRRAEAEIELSVEGQSLDNAFDRAFRRVKQEVKKQLDQSQETSIVDDLPF